MGDDFRRISLGIDTVFIHLGDKRPGCPNVSLQAFFQQRIKFSIVAAAGPNRRTDTVNSPRNIFRPSQTRHITMH